MQAAMTRRYIRPILHTDRARPPGALVLGGGWCWAARAEVLRRGAAPEVIPVSALTEAERAALEAPRPALAGLSLDGPRVMAIVNTTPDSFSDGGLHAAPDVALAGARAMVAAGADILDIGGESTRPGAEPVAEADETARTAPLIAALAALPGCPPISIDTRNAGVARAALAVGAAVVNDVSALCHDPAMAGVAAGAGAPVVLMHAQGDPRTMQDDPRYDDVLLDVYDMLEARIAAAEAAGIPRTRIVTDPGIGFGKTMDHNLALLRGIALFHSLGCPVLLGASRKRFIGALTDTPVAADRLGGSVGVALAALAQGVQILRVHDVAATVQAVAMWYHLLPGTSSGQ
jgi:dihydropteroate synthase